MRTISIESVNISGPLYVKSAAGIGKKAGDLNIDINPDLSSGRRELILIPKTFIPIRISDFAPVQCFINSISFRKANASGILQIIHPDDAEKELAKPESITELERLRQEIFSGVNFHKEIPDRISAIEAISEIKDDKINIKIKDLLLRSDIDDSTKLNLFRAEEPELTISDLEYILSTTENNTLVNNWCREVIDKKNGLFNK